MNPSVSSPQPAVYAGNLPGPAAPMIITTQQQREIKENYKVKTVLGLSYVQILFGSAAVVLQVWDIINKSAASVVGGGIWTGGMFIIAGILGVISCKTKKTCPIVAFLVMSIMAALFTIGLLTLSAISLENSQNGKRSARYYQHELDDYKQREYTSRNYDMIAAVDAILVLISIAEAIIAILSSAYACHGLCCSAKPQNVFIQGQVQYIPGPNGQTQMVIIPMPQQAGGNMANLTIQAMPIASGYQPQSLLSPTQGGFGPQMADGPSSPSQPPSYTEQNTLPPEYQEKEQPNQDLE